MMRCHGGQALALGLVLFAPSAAWAQDGGATPTTTAGPATLKTSTWIESFAHTTTMPSCIFDCWQPFPTTIYETTITTATRTRVEPATITLTGDRPRMITQTEIATLHQTYYTTLITFEYPALIFPTNSKTVIETVTTCRTSVWRVHKPAPTHLPDDGTNPYDIKPCFECDWPGYTPHPRCEELGLRTACQGQCRLRDGLFWCYRLLNNEVERPPGLYPLDTTPMGMGRVCWGKDRQFAQLLEPCIVGDPGIRCRQCENKDWAWSQEEWLGDYRETTGTCYGGIIAEEE